MMDGPSGTALTGESIGEAIDFRKRISSLAQAIAERDGWRRAGSSASGSPSR